MQRPCSDKSEAQQLLPKVHEILRRLMAVVVSSAFTGRGQKACIPHTFSLTKEMARFTKGGFRPYRGPKWPYEGPFCG